jgi:hypothetical protein
VAKAFAPHVLSNFWAAAAPPYTSGYGNAATVRNWTAMNNSKLEVFLYMSQVILLL